MIAATSLHVRRYAPRSFMAPHDHDEATFGMIVSGGFLERSGRRERSYGADHVTFCPAGVVHSQQFGAEGARQIIFTPPAEWLCALRDDQIAPDAPASVASAVFRSLGRRLLAEMDADDDLGALAREGLLLEIVAAFGRLGRSGRNGARPPAWLAAAREYIHAHARQPLSVRRVAQVVGRHEIHLAREFRRHFGTSVAAYLRRLRADDAARQLLLPQADITEIALRCGFASHAHLCRVFKAAFGMTPSQYRAHRLD